MDQKATGCCFRPLTAPPHRQPEAAKSGQIIYNFARETDKAEGKRDFPPRNVNVCESVCVRRLKLLFEHLTNEFVSAIARGEFA